MYVLRLINCSKDTSALLDSSLIVGAARAYMDEHFREKVTLDDLAQICFTNKYYISHLFTRMQGISIGKYLLHKRIEKAKYLLSETTLSAEAIAEQVGFRVLAAGPEVKALRETLKGNGGGVGKGPGGKAHSHEHQ